ncbi:MAG: hypothetical protein COT74_06495 [Bdellovibrionales bacterium CG10_big_fil_rev_8_21_14_0_10_45_34]|nr:MAG: hypothetical protein COT74_06495 [Bdellovibrionales bacterium CG10_big_fil_rev_8_21_14_0_10_45_34]
MKVIFLITFFFVSTVHAKVLVSVQHEVSAPVLKDIAKNIVEAKERPSDEMAMMAIYPIFDGNGKRSPFTLKCPPFHPNGHGEGCTLFVPVVNSVGVGSGTVKIEKKISERPLKLAMAKIEKLMSSEDPNAVEEWDHKQIGDPFSSSSNAGSHISCTSEGIRPDKKWRCLVSVSETLK